MSITFSTCSEFYVEITLCGSQFCYHLFFSLYDSYVLVTCVCDVKQLYFVHDLVLSLFSYLLVIYIHICGLVLLIPLVEDVRL